MVGRIVVKIVRNERLCDEFRSATLTTAGQPHHALKKQKGAARPLRKV
jgi:hypothetical protein